MRAASAILLRAAVLGTYVWLVLAHMFFFQDFDAGPVNTENATGNLSGLCDRFLTVPTTGAGLGDHLSHYFFGLALSARLGLCFVPDDYAARSVHDSAGYAEPLSTALGLNFTNDRVSAEGLVQLDFATAQNATALHSYPCSTNFSVSIESCPGVYYNWCPHVPAILSGLQYVRRGLSQRASYASTCSDRDTIFKRDYLNVALHIRHLAQEVDGTLYDAEPYGCENCNLAYFQSLQYWISSALGPFRYRVYIFARAWHNATRMWDDIILKSMPESTVVTDMTFTDTLCHWLNADLLITTGSSLSISVGAFSPQPVIVEEANYIAARTGVDRTAQYFLREGESVHMRDGRLEDWQRAELQSEFFFRAGQANRRFLQ